MKLSEFHAFKRKLNDLYINVKDSSMYKQLFNSINALECFETYCLGISYQIVSHSTLSRVHQIKLLDDFYEEAHMPFDPEEVYTMMENGPYTIDENPIWYGIDAMTSNRPGSVNFCLYYSLMTPKWFPTFIWPPYRCICRWVHQRNRTLYNYNGCPICGALPRRIHAGIKKSKLNAKKRLEWGNIQVFFSAFLFVSYYSIDCNRYQ